jgi:glycosyltransferase involved in cell wall biosynthesis
MRLLAVSYVLPPNLYPQAIQIGRLLYHCKDELGVTCGVMETQASGLDCYPNFSARLSYKIEVPFVAKIKGLLQRLAIYCLPFYGRCPDEYVGWVDLAAQKTLSFLKEHQIKPDRVLTFGEPMSDHLVGRKLRATLGVPWIAHFSDPWADNPFRRYFFLSKWINRRLESSVISEADRVVFTSQETLELVMKKYPASWREKAYVIAHGYQADLYPVLAEQEEVSPLVFRYVGNFYGDRTPAPLFEALAQIQHENPELLSNVHIELVGSIPARMLKTQAYRVLPKTLVKTISTVSYLESLELMAESDLLLIIDAPNRGVSVFLPSKLIDYIGAGKPIIGIVPRGASSTLIQRLGGAAADPSDSAAIRRMLTQAIALCVARRKARVATPWGDPTVREQYLIEKIAQDFFKIVHEASVHR